MKVVAEIVTGDVQKFVVTPANEQAKPMLYSPGTRPAGTSDDRLNPGIGVIVAAADVFCWRTKLPDVFNNADVKPMLPAGATGPLAVYVSVPGLTVMGVMNVCQR